MWHTNTLTHSLTRNKKSDCIRSLSLVARDLKTKGPTVDISSYEKVIVWGFYKFYTFFHKSKIFSLFKGDFTLHTCRPGVKILPGSTQALHKYVMYIIRRRHFFWRGGAQKRDFQIFCGLFFVMEALKKPIKIIRFSKFF